MTTTTRRRRRLAQPQGKTMPRKKTNDILQQVYVTVDLTAADLRVLRDYVGRELLNQPPDAMTAGGFEGCVRGIAIAAIEKRIAELRDQGYGEVRPDDCWIGLAGPVGGENNQG